MSDTKIEVTKNGPYIVSNAKALTNSKDTSLELSKTMALCRCGASKSKPFCDGSHGKVGFSGDLKRDRSNDSRKDFNGKDLIVSDNPSICAHAGYCDASCPKAFWEHSENGRSVKPDGEPKEKIISMIKRCPSGALSYKDNKTGKEFNTYHDGPTKIHVSKNGPLHVRGKTILHDENSTKPDSPDHYTLCRCGMSKNKPLCDGSHYNGFQDDTN